MYSTSAAPPARTTEQRATLLLAPLATLIVLVSFVTPLGTGARTATDLGSGPGTVAWLLSAMSLGLAVALLPAGALADEIGRRRVFVLGLGVLAAGSLVSAAATVSGTFVASRVLTGLGAGAVLACALGLLGHAFPPGPQRAHATGVWGAAMGGGIATGGLLTALVDPGQRWRGTYVVVAIAALLVAAAANRRLVESRAAMRRGPDILGAALLGSGLACVLAALVEGRSGWDRPAVLGLVAVGAALLAGFVRSQAVGLAPMLDLGLFRRLPFATATVGALANGLGATSLAAFLPTLVQRGLDRSLLAASLLVLLWAGSSVVTALAVRRLPLRWTGRWLIVGALLGIAVGHLAQSGLAVDSTLLRLVPGLLVAGIAFGVLNAVLGREAVSSVPPDRTAMGSGANNTARYVGSAIGIAVVAVVATRGAPEAGAAGLVAGWNTAALLTAVVSAAGAIVVSAMRPRPRQPLVRRPVRYSAAALQTLTGFERAATEAALNDLRLRGPDRRGRLRRLGRPRGQ